jgi:hypothetical protein
VYRRADLLRTITLVAALLPTAISTGAVAWGFAAGDSRNILTTETVADAIGVFHCRRFRAEMEPAWTGTAVRGHADITSMAGYACEVEQS